jgi:RNA polymerase sigma-70 factor (ECF subfamily)
VLAWIRASGPPARAGQAADPGDLLTSAYEAYQREIHSFALHSTRDPEVAADVTQEAFLKLLEVPHGQVPDNIRAWLYRVTTNLVINRAKHALVVDRVRRQWRDDDAVFESPETTTVRAEQARALHRALADVSRDARVGLLLQAHGFSGHEVAEAIGRTETATRALLCRARSQLRTALSEGGGA